MSGKKRVNDAPNNFNKSARDPVDGTPVPKASSKPMGYFGLRDWERRPGDKPGKRGRG